MSKDKIVYTLYECVQSIPELNIHKGQQYIKTENGSYKSIRNKNILPSYIDVSNTMYFREGEMEILYTPGDMIVYRLNKNNTAIGVVEKITSMNVIVSEAQNPKATRSIEHAQVLRKVECYYFISSTGSVQKAYVGKDKNADRWRKNTGNYYESSGDAHGAKYEIEQKFKKESKEF